MSITATELKENLGYYLALASKQTIGITKNGKLVAVLASPVLQKESALKSLIGIIPDDGSNMADIRQERLARQL